MRNELKHSAIHFGNELQHHGIKGMHWGDRRYQNEDGTLTPAGRVRYGYGQDRTIKKGTVVKRVTSEMNEEVGSERKYVNYQDRDSDIYKNFYARNVMQSKGRPYVYQNEYEVTKDLVVADEQAVKKAFDDLYKENKKYFGGNKKKAYADFNQGLQVRNQEINDKFFQKLKDAGYDAMQDQFSKQATLADDGTSDPLIILDPKTSMKLKQTNIIINNEQNKENHYAGNAGYYSQSESGRKWDQVAQKEGGTVYTQTQIGSLLKGMAVGAVGGAAVGTVAAPGVGTAIGAIYGGVIGLDVGAITADGKAQKKANKYINDKAKKDGYTSYRDATTRGNNSTYEINSYLTKMSTKDLQTMLKRAKGQYWAKGGSSDDGKQMYNPDPQLAAKINKVLAERKRNK